MTNTVVRRRRGTGSFWAIRNDETGLYFIWGYKNKRYAQYIAGKCVPERESDIQANWRRDYNVLVISDRVQS